MSLIKEFKSVWASPGGKAVIKVLTILCLIASASLFVTFSSFVAVSGFAVNLFRMFLGLIVFWGFDRFAVPEINTVEELKKGNPGYAIFLLAIAIIIGASIVAG